MWRCVVAVNTRQTCLQRAAGRCRVGIGCTDETRAEEGISVWQAAGLAEPAGFRAVRAKYSSR